MSRPARVSPQPSSLEVLSHNSKSFWLASLFLSKEQQRHAAQLYAFCRGVDDAVDETTDARKAQRSIERFRRELRSGLCLDPCVQRYRALMDSHRLPLYAAEDLLDGMETDLGAVRIETDDELFLYCYRVAGTVGIMMCGVLGVSAPKALRPAVRLGMAMQLSNICRDVLEDAQRDRVYLPSSRLRAQGISPEVLVKGEAPVDAIQEVVRSLLLDADQLYDEGRAGLHYIPWRSRFTIHVAAAVYQQIGHRLLRKHGGNPLGGRTVVPLWEKVWAIGVQSVRVLMGRLSLAGPSSDGRLDGVVNLMHEDNQQGEM
jgi:phytoene synthase